MSHSDDCPTGFGDGGYGEKPFGGDPGLIGGGPLPSENPFDIYCLGPCGPMAEVFTHPEVTQLGQSTQFSFDSTTFDLLIRSGGAAATDDARVLIDTTVPLAFTLEATVFLRDLPKNFSALQSNHIFLGTFDAQGNSVGLFIAETGLVYTGAVHHDSGVLVVDSPFQILPDSASLIEKNRYFVVRIATSYETGTTYIYWTREDDVATLGHQLRYILPAIRSSTAAAVPADSTLVSVRGTAASPSEIALDTLCLGAGLVIPNLPPRADAGSDQALRSCAIARFDGSKSFDPEGANITYKWRLVDAPSASWFCFEGHDALTYPELTPTGFTNHIYSADLADEGAADPISPGDVILLNQDVYEVVSTGIDGNGFFVDVGDDIVPDSYATGQDFKLLRQRGIDGATRVDPTFLPDKTGLYKFDLVVFDGALYSEPAVTVINVTASPVPRGVIPDTRFIWEYLTDFWRLVEDRERIEVFWSALAQVAASELLTVWQTDYAKSLRDVQRTFQRRWLHYDLLLKESSQLIDLSSVRALYGGVESSNIPTAGISGVAGNHLDIFLSTVPDPVVVFFPGSGDLTAQQIVDRINAYMHGIDPSVMARVIPQRDGTAQRVRIDAPFAFSIAASSTVTLFGTSSNTIPRGSGGSVVGIRSFRAERSLASLGIKEGDFLTVGSGTYRIARVVDDPSDQFFSQRLTLLEDLPFDAGQQWLISGQAVSTSLDFYDGLVTAGDVVTLEVIDSTTNALFSIALPATGACASAPSVLGLDTTLVGQYLSQQRYSVLFFSVLRRQYTPIDPLVVDVPYLQEKIKNEDDQSVLRRNVDYFVEEFRGRKCLRFAVNNDSGLDVWQGGAPPDRLWAETTYLDNRPTIEANFGIPAEFTLDDLSTLPENVDYLSAVRGLWFAYFRGPTLANVRVGAQILLGLPFAEVAGTIEEIRDDFSTAIGRILVRDAASTDIVRTYTYPHGLSLETNPATKLPYAVGDSVGQFAPLVKGVDVLDYIKDPEWFEGLLNQGSFSEVEKFFKFMVRVDSQAFNLNALLFVRQFVLRIKPTYTYPLFVVRTQLSGDTEISISDSISYKGRLTMHAGPFFPATNGQAQMWDQPRPGGGGYWNQLDRADGNSSMPTFPTSDSSVAWGLDESNMAPREAVLASLKATWGGGAPIADSIFYADCPVYTVRGATLVGSNLRHLPVSPGVQLDVPQTSTVTATLNAMSVFFKGIADGQTLTLTLKKNGSTVVTQTFTPLDVGTDIHTADAQLFAFTISVGVVPGDVLTAFVSHPTGFNTFVRMLSVIVGVGQTWSFDTSLSAGTYYTYIVL